MHTRSIVYGLLITVFSLAAACGSSTTLPIATTSPTTASLTTDTFSGTLNQNGGATYPFAANAAGTVTATVKAINPDATVAIGVALGNWNGSTCAWAVANDNALVGSAVSGTTSGATSLCLRVYDIGKIGDTAITFSVDISHP